MIRESVTPWNCASRAATRKLPTSPFAPVLRTGFLAVILATAAALPAQAAQIYFQGFETDNAGWNVFGGTNDATRVPLGTNGVTSASGSFHAEAAGPATIEIAPQDGSAATNWGGYSSVFPAAGFTTSLDIYLNVGTAAANDTWFDWDSAMNNSSGNFLRDFIFNCGFYNATDAEGAGARYVCTASNNAGRLNSFPENPGRNPFDIKTTGWYTFQEHFYNNAGVLADDLSILNSSDVVLHTWTLSDPTDLIGGVGGNRYGWVVDNEFPFLAIDNASLTTADVPEPASLALFGAGLVGFGVFRRRRKTVA